jgi:hypothetical protein
MFREMTSFCAMEDLLVMRLVEVGANADVEAVRDRATRAAALLNATIVGEMMNTRRELCGGGADCMLEEDLLSRQNSGSFGDKQRLPLQNIT